MNLVLIISFVGKCIGEGVDQFFEFDGWPFRSLTIDLRNARERLEAYKFIRRLVFLYPQRLPHSFVYVLDGIVSSSQTISLPRNANSTTIIRSDQMVKCCLELLCEIGKQSINFIGKLNQCSL